MAHIDISTALKHFEVSTTSINAAVYDVHQVIDFDPDMDLSANPVLEKELKGMRKEERASFFLARVFGLEVSFDNYDAALMTCQKMVENAIKDGCIVEDADLALVAAKNYVEGFMAKPENKWMLLTNAIRISPTSTAVVEKREVGGVEMAVAVTTDGKFKKGEKERIAIDLYKKYMSETKEPTNQGFIAILMKELGMSKAGATTYNYNMKQKMNPERVTAKPKRA